MTNSMKMIEFDNIQELYDCMGSCPICHTKFKSEDEVTLYIYIPIPNIECNIVVVDNNNDCHFYNNKEEVIDIEYKATSYSPRRITCSCGNYYYSVIYVINIGLKKLSHIYLSSQIFSFFKENGEFDVMYCKYNGDVIELSENHSSCVYSFDHLYDNKKKIKFPYFEKIVTDPYEVYSRVKKLVVFL